MLDQIQYDIHQLEYIIHYVNKFHIVIMHECVIHIRIEVVMKLLDSISWLTSRYIHDEQNSIRYTSTTIYYPTLNKFRIVIMYECQVIRIQIPKSNQICSFLTILDSISRLTLICINVGPNSIRYTLTTIYYPSCQQISGCYNSVFFDPFGQYLQINLNLYWCWTKFNTIHINYNILSIVSTNIRKCKVIHIQIPKSNQIRSFLTLLDSISRLTLICFDIGPNSIRYTLTTIYYPSCQQISRCYKVQV